MKYAVCLGVVALSVALAGPTNAHAQSSSALMKKTTALKFAKIAAKEVSTTIDIAEILDELTKTEGELALVSLGRNPVKKGTFIGTEFLVPQVEFEDHISNKLSGWEIPWRRVNVKICIDCDVECRVNISDIKFARDESYEDTVVVTVPELELIGRVPQGREFQYEVDYGALRAQWLDSENARILRKKMVSGATRKAVEELRNDQKIVEFRKEFKRDLHALLKRTLPKDRRIVIKFEEK
jgi:hypothetical protein